MCGISGIAYTKRSGRNVDPDLLARMRDLLRHRGPDEAGSFVDGNVGLGHRRLSIVDVKSGQQPMATADNQCFITYNGEVYNHKEYRQQLEAKGYKFRTNCDTEAILYLYQEYGDQCVHKLRGMFAFAIWNKDKRELFLARDRLGVKPLYYVQDEDGSIFFASEIKALLEAGAVRPSLNYAVLADYLANHSPTGEETLFVGVKRLLPGHSMSWRDGKLSVDRYWDLEFEPKQETGIRSDAEWVVEWSERFEEAVRIRLMSDVPLGMFLSGGIDSSAIAAVMSGLSEEPVKTFSVAFAEREANELEYARMVADRFSTDHHEVIVSPAEFCEALPDLIWHEDEPIAHPSSVALYFVSQLASRHVKVVLTGEGSDESLAGYGRYAKTLLNLRLGQSYSKFVPKFTRELVAAGIDILPAASRTRHKLKKSFLSLDPTIESIYFDNFSVFSRTMQKDLFTESAMERMAGRMDPYEQISAMFGSAPSQSLLDRMLYADTKTYLQELLMKQDQMSMAASIESRVPFLDHQLMEFTARMPDSMKLRGNTTKFVLRKAMEGRLPQPILSRSKMGFPVPIGKWLREEYRTLVNEYVLSERALERKIFEPAGVRDLVERHMRGENHDERLWALINFEMWQRRFIDAEVPRVPESAQSATAAIAF